MNASKNFEYSIEFFNREREKEEILHILKTEPQLLNFIYGPMNSGKTALITNLIEELSSNYVVFYTNLRARDFSDGIGLLRDLFGKTDGMFKKLFGESDVQKTNETTKAKIYSGIPASEKSLNEWFKEENRVFLFTHIKDIMRDMESSGKHPVWIIDEIQMMDKYVDKFTIYNLFQFFIRLTKELHLCYIFVLSSDILFIKKVHEIARLDGRANYIVVDDFDEETARKFLKKYKFSDEDANYAIDNFGGKIGNLIQAIYKKKWGKELSEVVDSYKNITESSIWRRLSELKLTDGELFKKVIEVFKEFENSDVADCSRVDYKALNFLIKAGILFSDLYSDTVKPQSKIDLLAIREILKEMKF
ncbi:MAG: hypothetical protein CVT88_08485 [Candidatus Altiarchaeales archaeon HGW-Altiarchaeales-1]|nr:MAG: hypothetical protein CVT88_08485 [Candidatus Altiarchaeales archaeon HGW-Altiarchaeales-1]